MEKYFKLLDKIDVNEFNHGHSIESVLRNSKREFTTDNCLTNCICASLYFCEEYSKYDSLTNLSYCISNSIKEYNTKKIEVYNRAKPIFESYLQFKNIDDAKHYMGLYSYSLFDLYNNYKKEEIAGRFEKICKYIGVDNIKFDDVLPNYDLVKNQQNEIEKEQ